MHGQRRVIRVLAGLAALTFLAGGIAGPTPAASPTVTATPTTEPTTERTTEPTVAPTRTPTSSPNPSFAFSELAGAWSGVPANEPGEWVTLTIEPCEDGDVCGTGTWIHTDGNRCTFTFAHSATDEPALFLTVVSGEGMQCGWGGPRIGTTFRVEPAPDGTLQLFRETASELLVTLVRDGNS